MSAVLRCYADDETMKWLEKAAAELGRNVEQLAEAAIENAAIEFKNSQPRIPVSVSAVTERNDG